MGGGSPAQVPEESTADEDAAFETKDAAAVTLYKVSDSAGSLQVDTISTKPIRQEMLKSEVSVDCVFMFCRISQSIRCYFSVSLLKGLLHFGHWFGYLRVGWQKCNANGKNTIDCPSSKYGKQILYMILLTIIIEYRSMFAFEKVSFKRKNTLHGHQFIELLKTLKQHHSRYAIKMMAETIVFPF